MKVKFSTEIEKQLKIILRTIRGNSFFAEVSSFDKISVLAQLPYFTPKQKEEILMHRLSLNGIFLEWDQTFSFYEVKQNQILRNLNPLTREELAVEKKHQLEKYQVDN